MKTFRAVVALGVVFLLVGPGLARAAPDEDLQKRVRDLETQVQELKQLLQKREKTAAQDAATKEELSKLEKKVEELQPGLENMLLTGYSTAAFQAPESGNNFEGINNSTFAAMFNPLFLFTYDDRLIFEGELELGLGVTLEGDIEDADATTDLELEYAQIAYFLNDYVTIGVGKFLVPFNIFPERLHPAWINKLPTAPLPYQHHGGIAPMAEVGAQVRGGIPLFDNVNMNYALYVSNGPILLTDGDHAGELRFTNQQDINGNKAFGGRIGILPTPELEAGFSYQLAEAGTGAFEGIDAHLLGADLSYVQESEFLAGHVDFRFEYVGQWIENAVYTVDGTTFAFDNEKWAWYAQIAYRPTLLESRVLSDLEVVFRYTRQDWPSGTPLAANEPGEGVDRQQFSIGLNYWITPSVPLKIAYDFNENLEGGVKAGDVFFVQVSYGF
jgi:hypothetical protein